MIKLARVAAVVSLCLSLALWSMPSYAGLWEHSLTGLAILPGGQKGVEVARYVWDPASVTSCFDNPFDPLDPPCPSATFPLGSALEVWQAPTTVSYFGLVNGTATGVVESSEDRSLDVFRLGGSRNVGGAHPCF
jgi:hypothetical protein